jgi:hypothetical protein
MIRIVMLVALAAGTLLLPVSDAVATPADDARAVYNDWRPDGQITPCRFTRAQLVNARNITPVDYDSYAPGFRDQMNREIARYDSGGCKGVSPDAPARKRSAIRKLRISKARPKGGLRESVTIRNSSSGGVSLKGVTLRDRSGHRVKLGSGRLGGRRSLRVFTGCAKGRRKAYRSGSTLYACLRRQVWDDKGDVVKIVDRRGVTVAQRGYGSRRGVVRF